MKKGFTLVETIIALGLFSLLLGTVISLNSYFQRTWGRSSTRSWQSLQAETIFLRLSRELRFATSVDTPAGGDRGSVLQFRDDQKNDVKYQLDTRNRLIRESSESGGRQTIAEGIEEFQASRFSPDVLGLEISIAGREGPFRAISGVYLRNEGCKRSRGEN